MQKASFTIQDQPFSIDLEEAFNAHSFEVKSFPRPYTVRWDDSALPLQSVWGALSEHPGNLLLIDEKVLALHGIPELLNFDPNKIFRFRASEETKTLEGMTQVLDLLDRNEVTRTEKLIIAGGGITQEVGTFAAKVFKRGIPTVLFPTTLLAQCDSCIGGKTGLNFKGAKNQVALIAPPCEVVINPNFLKTLSSEDLASGMGEVFKSHILGGPELLESYRKNFESWKTSKSMEALSTLIRGSLAVKRAIVEADEFESGIRKSLNYGHTLGHAIETLTNYEIPHGLAVVAGMILVNELSMRKGWLSEKENVSLKTLALELLPSKMIERIKTLSLDTLLSVLQKDKKTQSKTVAFTFLKRLGELEFVPCTLNAELIRGIQNAMDHLP